MAKAAKKAVRRAVVKKAVRKKVASAVRLEPHKVEFRRADRPDASKRGVLLVRHHSATGHQASVPAGHPWLRRRRRT